MTPNRHTPADPEFVTHRQWDGYARRIERENLRERGSSLTATGIARRANSFIIEIQDDRAGMLVKPGWREAMRREPRAYSFLQDRALEICVAGFGTCPFGCAKDGAPNCHANVSEGRCEPGRLAQAEGGQS